MKILKGITETSAELASRFRKEIEEKHNEPEKWRGLQFGHADLDKLTGGIRKGEFVVVAGAQKAGKTTVALSWAQSFSKQVQPDELVLYVSLEMEHDAIAGRVLSNLSDIEVSKFRDYKLASRDWDKLDRGVEKMSKLPVLWNVGAFNMKGIEAIVEEYGDKIRVIVLDYFQLMMGDDGQTKRFEQLENISRKLKHLTLSRPLSVLAVSQQSRTALGSIQKQKDPNTMAGTQALARDCSLLLVILPYLEDGEQVPHLRKLYVALSRTSAYDVTFNAYFSGAYSRFGAITQMEIEDMPDKPLSDWTNH